MSNSFVKGLMDEWTGKLSEDGSRKEMPRLEHKFEMDHEICRPGVFPGPFSIGLAEASNASELQCIKKAKGDPIRFGMEMAKVSIREVNGEKIAGSDRDWFWEALGARGRSYVVRMYSDHIAGNPDELDDEGND